MTGIVVSVVSPTESGRLYPRYDEATGILAAESRVERPWSFGVDIDGRIIFDLDDDRTLANFDLHIPKKRWRVGLSDEVVPLARPGDLVFTQESTAIKSFSIPLTIRTDALRQRVRIDIGDRRPDRLVALSSSCIALLAGDELVGFAIKDLASTRA